MEQTVTRPRLSILICRLMGDPVRDRAYTDLVTALDKQTRGRGDNVAIQTVCDFGEMSVGAKRNKLLDIATGDYIAFVDDDDMVSDTYVADILAATADNPDCTTLVGQLAKRAPDWSIVPGAVFKHSTAYQGWYTGADGVYYRTPNHLNPVRREIAQAVRFRDIRFGEDADYSRRIRPLLKTEGKIDRLMYTYITRDTGMELI